MSAGPPLPANLWESLPPQAQALILGLQAEAAELRAKVCALQQQVADLQERLNQNSTNSSRPPSSDAPAVKRRPPCPPSGRTTGGQPATSGGNGPFSRLTTPWSLSPRSAGGAAMALKGRTRSRCATRCWSCRRSGLR